MNNDKRHNAISNIQSAINIPIHFGNSFTAPITTQEAMRYLGNNFEISSHHYPFVEDVHQYYEKVFGWIKANPSIPELKKYLLSVHIKQQTRHVQ